MTQAGLVRQKPVSNRRMPTRGEFGSFFARRVHLKIVFFCWEKMEMFLEFGENQHHDFFQVNHFFQLCVKVKDEIEKEIINLQERPGKNFDDPAVLI